MIDIRLPNITSATEAGQLSQIRSYLYQFAEQMQWALNTLEKGASSENVVVNGTSSKELTEDEALKTFDGIKSLIIKSADIVEAYYEKIDNLLDLDGKYVATAEFGEEGVAQYIKDTAMNVCATSEYIEQNFYTKETIDDIDDRVVGIEGAVREQKGYIRTGNVGCAIPGYEDENTLGMEIGEFDTENGEATKVTKRYARYTSQGLELFGGDLGNPVAYIHQYKLYITNAEFTGIVVFGGYQVDTSNGLAFKWIGRD